MSQDVRVKWNGAAVGAKVTKAAQEGLYQWAKHVLERANRLVPHQEGTLEGSGVAHEPGTNGLEQLQAAVSYDTPYALRQHEETGWVHPQGRQAKYLETPLNSEADTGLTLVQRSIKRALG